MTRREGAGLDRASGTGHTLHASAVAVAGRGLLITGRAGSGKTTLALEMIALGAELVADDRVIVEADGAGRAWLSAPETIAGLVEVRGFGLARLSARARAPVALVADLDEAAPERLPERRTRKLAGIACPVFPCKGKPGLAAALTCLLGAEAWPGPEHFAGRGEAGGRVMQSAEGEAARAAASDSGQRVVIVTGMSGAGRTTAIHALEDLGFEVLENFPLALVDRLVKPGEAAPRPIAIGVETRTRGFSARALTGLVDRLRRRQRIAALLVFLDCGDEALMTRFNQTRRRHPLAPEEDVATGVARERDLLSEVRGRADLVIDTTTLAPQVAAELVVAVQSFSYKRGAPSEADMVLDCRFLKNPYWEPALRHLDGRDARIQGFVRGDPLFRDFFARLGELLEMLLPAYKAEGKAYFCVALGCTGGRHRSVVIGELLAGRLREAGWPVMLRHRELGGDGTGEKTAGGTGR